ncbi:MAG: methyltransferase domain-containing protein, partial [Bacteroidetes bacterium]|nr:methyltransferase domain-containing protein [Bacteroidota bacterium]
FIRQKSGINATVFDLPNVVNLTEEYIRKEGFAGQITTAAGDYLKDPLPEGFDIVFLSAVIHSNSYTENEALISKCAGSLNPGGRVIVQDFVMEECRTKPAYGAIFAMNMLVATPSGDTYTEEEVKTWMKKAGLSDFMRIDQNFGTSQIIGRKPE